MHFLPYSDEWLLKQMYNLLTCMFFPPPHSVLALSFVFLNFILFIFLSSFLSFLFFFFLVFLFLLFFCFFFSLLFFLFFIFPFFCSCFFFLLSALYHAVVWQCSSGVYFVQFHAVSDVKKKKPKHNIKQCII